MKNSFRVGVINYSKSKVSILDTSPTGQACPDKIGRRIEGTINFMKPGWVAAMKTGRTRE